MHQFLMQGDPVVIILTVLLAALATESLVSLIKDSDFSQWLIHPIVVSRYNNNSVWYNLVLYKWITCGHCMSFIYSLPFAIAISASLTGPFSFLIVWLVLQRLSNWFNDAYKLLSRGRATAIEFLSPLIEVKSSMSSGDYFEQIKERQFRRGSLQVTNIRTLSDIQRIIKSTSSSHDNAKNSTAIIDGKKFSIDTSTHHPSYMQMIKDMLLEEKELQEPTENEPVMINGEVLIPIHVQSTNSVERMIEKFTGGVRDGDRIKWELSDGTYFYDPITEKLTKLE